MLNSKNAFKKNKVNIKTKKILELSDQKFKIPLIKMLRTVMENWKPCKNRCNVNREIEILKKKKIQNNCQK